MRLRGASLLIPLFLAASCTSTANAPVPTRDCSLVIWHHASADAYIEITGDWDGWARGAHVMRADRSDGWRVASFDLPPGEHAYAIVEDGVWIADPNVPTSAYHDGNEVAWVDIADCAAPALRVDDARGSADAATIRASFLASKSGDALDPRSLRVTERDGAEVVVSAEIQADRASFAITASLAPGKHTLTLHASDTAGRPADDARAVVWIAPAPFDARDTVLYQVIVDRYRDAAGALASPSDAAGRAGGTLDGVRSAIDSGELAALGFNTLWISPLYTNPAASFPGSDGHRYSSYHGYWPIAPRSIDARLGTEAALDALIASAHAHGMRVLFDVVPNHVHQEHPYVAEHMQDAWFNNADGSCVCGSGACDWSTHIQDCWFASYLPDLDWKKSDVADQITSDVRWWIDRFDGDGLRIDAVPMMPRAATRRIVNAVRGRYDHPGNRTFLLGENFTGPLGYSLLRYELGPFGLDSEFHFPLMWALRSAIAQGTGAMSDIDAAIAAGDADWQGSGAIMTTMIGNHDVSRFASVSAGEGDADPWTPARQAPETSDVYAKQSLALQLLFALPGAPVVYYGDEIALAGHADPDSRRVMPSEASLSAAQRAVRTSMQAMAQLRACAPALRRGTYRRLFADAEHLVFARELPGEDTAIVVVSRAGAAFTANFPGITAGDYVDALTGGIASLRPELTNLTTAPLSLQLFLPKSNSCGRRK